MSDDQSNQRAAAALARLIHHGIAAVPPADLPEDWREAYQAVRAVSGGLFQRQQAFQAAIAGSSFAVHMELEVEDAFDAIPDPPQDSLRVYSAWETLDQPPAQDWCVQGIITRPSLNMLVGAPGAKKTWLALDLAVSVASGQPWLGHPVGAHGNAPSQSSPLVGAGSPRPGIPVLILDQEGGLQRTWDRLGRTLRGHGLAGESLPGVSRADSPKGHEVPLHFIPPAGYNLANPSEVDAIAARARSLKAGLIIIDALVNVMSGVDENNVLSMQPVIANLSRLAREANAAVLVIHHANKRGVFRGSSLIASGVDHMLAIESAPDEDIIHLVTLKARDIAPVSLTAQASFGRGPGGQATFHLTPASTAAAAARSLSPAAGEILGLLQTEPMTFPELTACLADIAPGSIRNLLHYLVTSGHVQRADGGSRGQKALYQLANAQTPIPGAVVPSNPPSPTA
ncbi:MAG: AAA family ATPase [Anaerolineales bacterium]|nr:AAA family ATPase [Anaerolineales bacterium]